MNYGATDTGKTTCKTNGRSNSDIEAQAIIDAFPAFLSANPWPAASITPISSPVREAAPQELPDGFFAHCRCRVSFTILLAEEILVAFLAYRLFCSSIDTVAFTSYMFVLWSAHIAMYCVAHVVVFFLDPWAATVLAYAVFDCSIASDEAIQICDRYREATPQIVREGRGTDADGTAAGHVHHFYFKYQSWCDLSYINYDRWFRQRGIVAVTVNASIEFGDLETESCWRSLKELMEPEAYTVKISAGGRAKFSSSFKCMPGAHPQMVQSSPRYDGSEMVLLVRGGDDPHPKWMTYDHGYFWASALLLGTPFRIALWLSIRFEELNVRKRIFASP